MTPKEQLLQEIDASQKWLIESGLYDALVGGEIRG